MTCICVKVQQVHQCVQIITSICCTFVPLISKSKSCFHSSHILASSVSILYATQLAPLGRVQELGRNDFHCLEVSHKFHSPYILYSSSINCLSCTFDLFRQHLGHWQELLPWFSGKSQLVTVWNPRTATQNPHRSKKKKEEERFLYLNDSAGYLWRVLVQLWVVCSERALIKGVTWNLYHDSMQCYVLAYC